MSLYRAQYIATVVETQEQEKKNCLKLPLSMFISVLSLLVCLAFIVYHMLTVKYH